MDTPNAQKNSLHPIVWIAAIAVILVSLVGIAAMTGLLPIKSAPEAAAPPETAAVQPPPPPEAAPPMVQAPPPEAPVIEKKVVKPAAKPKQTATYSSKPKHQDNGNTVSYSSQPPAPPPPCPDCAVVSSIEPVAVEGEGTGLGAIAGGILGGVLGNQIGGGSGKDVARIAGIAGGAYAGHQVEKSQRSHTAYDIVVRFSEDGSTQRIRENAQPVWQVGDKVRVEGGKLVPR